MKNLIKEAGAVDVNCAIGRGRDCRLKFESVEELASCLRKYHIARGVVTSLMARNWNLKDGNDWLFTQISGYDHLAACATLSSHLGTSELPLAPELRRYLKANGVRAVRLYPKSSCYHLDAFYAGALLGLLNELRLPLLVDWVEIDPAALPRVCGEFPEIPFVFLGAGFNQSRLMYPLLEKRPNVFFDLSRFADYGIVEEIVAKFGAGRLLFGSGMPFLNPGAAITYVCYAEITEKDQRMILSGNWKRMVKEIRL